MPDAVDRPTLEAMVSVATEAHDVYEELSPPLTETDAVVEADRCLDCGGPYAPAPCATACPAGVDVPGFITAIADGRPDEAAATIFAENMLGGTCARVCPVELLCEGACVLAHEGRRPIEIGRLQRFAADHALAEDLPLRRRAPHNWRRVAVIGAGPAGLVCAGELAARGYSVSVYEEHVEPGGLARFAIAPYRQLREPLPQEARLLSELGVSFELGIGIDTPESVATIEASHDAVVLAIGLGADTPVALPGADLPGVWNSLPFIEAIKTGAPPIVGRSVVVIGGGNTAIDVAREAVRLGAREVTVLYRRTRTEMPAYAHEVDEALDEAVRFEWLTVPVRFVGETCLTGVECRRAELGDPDASGRRRPVEVTGSEFVVPAETAVNAIGQQPRADFLQWIAGVELDHGRLVVDRATGRTGKSKFFAAGDVTNGGATVVEAVREAKIAARGVDEWLRSEAS
jgi:dihydropyrimidine dehydrogenase (NAD+) subunit PreT